MKKILLLSSFLGLFSLSAQAQSLIEAEKTFSEGNFAKAKEQFSTLLKTASDNDLLTARLRLVACEYNLGEYLNAAKTAYSFELPQNNLWRARYLLYRIQTAKRVSSVYNPLLQERETFSEDNLPEDLSLWTSKQWQRQIQKDYQQLWSLRSELINAPIEREVLIISSKDTDIRRIPTLFDFVTSQWLTDLPQKEKVSPLQAKNTEARSAAESALERAEILRTAYLLEGKNRQNARIFWKTDFILLPYEEEKHTDDKALSDQNFRETLEELKLITGETKAKQSWLDKLKGYVSPTENMDYGRAYAAYRTAELLNRKGQYAEALQTCEYALQHLQKNYYTEQCQSLTEEIRQPYLAIYNTKTPVNPQKTVLEVNSRNIEKIYIRIYKTNFETLKNFSENNTKRAQHSWKFIQELDQKFTESVLKTAPLRSFTAAVSYDKPYGFKKSSLSLPALETGFYVVALSSDERFDIKTSVVRASLINATDLALFATAAIQDEPSKYVYTLQAPKRSFTPEVFHFYTLNLKTGETEGGVHLDIFKHWNGEKEKAATLDNGQVSLARKILVDQSTNNSYFVNALAYKNGDYTAMTNPLYFHFYNQSPVRIFVQTDRAVYRPNQNIELSVNAFEKTPRGLKTLENKEITFTIENPNYDTVFSAKATLNAFGTAQTHWTLPQDALLGNYRIIASLKTTQKTYRGNASFALEEFKQPEYEVNLKDSKKDPEYDKPFTVEGEAKYYFGAPLEKATVKYTVHWEEYTPPFYWWRRILTRDSILVASGETKTDKKGAFRINFTPEKSHFSNEGSLFSNYKVEVHVFDESGRAIQAVQNYKVADKPLLFQVDFTQGFYNAREEAVLANIKFLDINARAATGKVKAQLVQLKQNENTEKEEQNTHQYIESFNPENSFLDEYFKNASEEKTVFVQELSFHKDSNTLPVNLPALEEGVYRLKLSADKAQTQEVVFIVAEEKSNLQLPAITLAQHKTYYPNTQARILIGSSQLKGKKWIEVYQKNSFLLQRHLLDRGIEIFTLPITEENRGGLSLQWFGVSDYQTYSGNTSLEVPFDNKKLQVTITGKDIVRPAEKASWALSVQDADGKPINAQASVTIYDKSLDYYAKKENPFSLNNLFSQTNGLLAFRDSFSPVYFRNFSQIQTNPIQAEFPSLGLPYLNLTGRLFRYNGLKQKGMPMMARATAANAIAFEESSTVNDSIAFADTGSPETEVAAYGAISEKATAETPSVAIRNDFAHTAYFNTMLSVTAGKASFQTKMPEQLTEWNILGFALTKDADFGSFAASAITQKDFMLRLQLPRFYREKDQGVIQAAVTNLTHQKITANVELFITESGKDKLKNFGIDNAVKTVTVPAGDTRFISWETEVPQAPALYEITAVARAGKNTDGEKQTLPVLPAKQRLLASRHIALKNGVNTLTLDELKNNDEAVYQTAVLQFSPSLALSVLNYMPHLLQTPYRDLVSTLNRYVPLAVVNKFYTTYPQLKTATKKLPKRNSLTPSWDVADPLRQTLLEQTPWLRASKGDPQQKSDIIDIFNPKLVQHTQKKELAQIEKLQNPTGAFTWVPNGPDDDFLTLYALDLFSQAYRYEADIPEDMVIKAIDYILPKIEKRLKMDSPSEQTLSFALYAAYTLSAFPAQWSQIQKAKPYIKNWVDYADKHSQFMTTLGKTYAAAVYHRLGDAVKANRYLDLILSQMKENPLTGAYFAPEPQSWIWYNDTLSTQTATLKTLLEIRPDSDKVDALVQWILFNKEVNVWNNAKAASQAVFTLLDVMEHKGALSLPITYQVKWADEEKHFTFRPDDWSETLRFVKQAEEISPALFTASINKQGGLTDFASLSVIYETAKAAQSPKGVINVERNYFIRFEQDGIEKIRPVADADELKVGDEVEVHLTLTTDSAFEYVLLKDPKPAGFESADLLSGWEYGTLIFYRENKDASTNFFINRLPAGTVTLKYLLRPTTAGRLHNTAAEIQSMYAPEYAAHSATELFNVVK